MGATVSALSCVKEKVSAYEKQKSVTDKKSAFPIGDSVAANGRIKVKNKLQDYQDNIELDEKSKLKDDIFNGNFTMKYNIRFIIKVQSVTIVT